MIALIAGTGDLPKALVAELPARDLIICELVGFTPDLPDDLQRLQFRLETLGTLIQTLRDRGVDQVCMAGTIRRPDVDPTLIDDLTKPLVPAIMAALSKGDDGALRIVFELFENAGISVVAAHDVAPSLIPPHGVLTRHGPTDQHIADAEIGDQIIVEMGRKDSGQACIIQARKLIVEEGIDGTDAMIASVCADPSDTPENAFEWFVGGVLDYIKGKGDAHLPAENGILFKAPKPNQDRRADLPVIGPKTAMRAAEAGLAGIVIEADGVMVLDLPSVRGILDAQGMFLWVRPRT